MNKEIIKRIITERHQEVRERKLSKRPYTFEAGMNYVLVGLRRAGKSCLMIHDMQERIISGEIAIEDCLYVNFEDERIRYIASQDLGQLLDAYAEMFGNRRPHVYLDEIQIIDGWEFFVRRLADQQYRVMVTGSNAKMLSREIATTLGGRFIIREVWPFSFHEYLTFQGFHLSQNWLYDSHIQNEVVRQMNTYFTNGGFAETFGLLDKREWINSLYQKILLGDIVARNAIRGTRSIRLLVRKLAESVMQPMALARLQHIVLSSGDKISLPTLKDYLQYLEESYLTFSLSNIVSSFSERETLKKRYFSDNGLLNNFLLDGKEKLLENVCAIHLLRHFSHVDEPRVFYYSRNVEVDFYVPEVSLAVQASVDVSEHHTREREVGALTALHRYSSLQRAVIVTLNQEEYIQTEELTIEVLPLWKWLILTL